MDLKKLIKIVVKEKRLVITTILMAGLLGASAHFFLPKKHYASGTIFVKRSIYPYSESHFTYEGYYGQQAAIAYANSVISIIESEDVSAAALRDLEKSVNEKSLREFSRKIRAKKVGPQVITLVAKENTAEEAEKLWNTVANNTAAAVSRLGSSNDPFVGISKIAEKPVLKESYSSLPVFAVTGMGLGAALSLLVVTCKSYFSTGKKKKKWF